MDSYKYNCIYCNYETNSGQAWYQHKKSKKHIKNENIAIEKNKVILQETADLLQCSAVKEVFKCIYCSKTFTRKDNLNVH